MNMSDEWAKAVQEVAKTSGQLIEVTQRVGSFISKIVGGASAQIGGILEDNAKLYRYKNLLNIADKVQAIHVQRRIDGKTVPMHLRLAIPMLDSAALEDDERLQDVWARLIANGTDPNFKESLHPGFIEIIRQMSPDEAIILNSFLKMENYPILFLNHVSKEYEETNLHGGWFKFSENKPSYEGIYELYSIFCQNIPLKESARARVYIDNLQRLRIVELGHNFSGQETESLRVAMMMSFGSDSEKKSASVPARDEYLRMTVFGTAFVTACISEEVRISNT